LQSFLPAFDHLSAMAGRYGEAPEVQQLLASALVCGASVCQALGPLCLPKLPRLVPCLLEVLALPAVQGSPPVAVVADAALVGLTAVIASVPNFLHPFLPRLLAALLEPRQSQQHAHRALSLLAKGTPARLLLPVLFSSYARGRSMGPAAVVRMLGLLSEAVQHCQRAEVVAHLPQLTSFFLTAMDFRNDRPEAAQVSQLESQPLLTCTPHAKPLILLV
jgi:U3 small nucleolar RNA-associated protein 10